MNNEAKAYFETLPKWLRENILQSGATVHTKNELEELVRSFSDQSDIADEK